MTDTKFNVTQSSELLRVSIATYLAVNLYGHTKLARVCAYWVAVD